MQHLTCGNGSVCLLIVRILIVRSSQTMAVKYPFTEFLLYIGTEVKGNLSCSQGEEMAFLP